MRVGIRIEDDLAVRELYARAIHLFDSDDEAWLDCWADNPKFHFPPDPSAGFLGMTLESRGELTTMLHGANTMSEHKALHHFTNLTFDYVDAGVRVRGYLLLVKSGGGQHNPAVIMQNSRIDDLVVNTERGWRFKHRSVGSIWG
jgi:SnoaL-like domain